MEHEGSSFPDTIYYCGSEEGYDYFYIEYGAMGYDDGRKYRLLSSKSPVQKRFDRTTDEHVWVKTALPSP